MNGLENFVQNFNGYCQTVNIVLLLQVLCEIIKYTAVLFKELFKGLNTVNLLHNFAYKFHFFFKEIYLNYGKFSNFGNLDLLYSSFLLNT